MYRPAFVAADTVTIQRQDYQLIRPPKIQRLNPQKLLCVQWPVKAGHNLPGSRREYQAAYLTTNGRAD